MTGKNMETTEFFAGVSMNCYKDPFLHFLAGHVEKERNEYVARVPSSSGITPLGGSWGLSK